MLQHHFIQANRIRLHYVTEGEGDLVILLHGFPEFWYSWRYQIPVLARHFKVVVPDLRGYNQSDKPSTGYDLTTLASDIKGLIENLGYERAHIVGHDFGGAIAWRFAQKFPHMLNRLAILSAPHPSRFAANLIQDLNQLRRSWYIFAFQVPGLPEWLIQQNLKNFVQTVFRGLAVRKGFFTRETSAMYEAALRQPGAIASALNYYRQLFSPLIWISDTWSTMSSGSPQLITAPTLVLWGEEDAVLSARIAEDLRHAVSASFELKFLPNCGHWIQQESPQTVNRELLAFFGMSEEEN
ncbi:MAG: alpha/beta hydrolase [Alkalinema sp. CAN_BIN05]|nr:alpha/beta hydrolase [Alkalinema sp. CAN_BIN05]